MAIYMWRDVTPAGIYWSSSLGLITIADGSGNDITIADKHLGATTVYNNGDALSEANCGKYYQWGNNYGFPFTGTVTTSSTAINTSTYGPGNYYSSSTFITGSSSPYNRSSPTNNNLWGDTTDTNIARRGPCSEGYHIPSYNEANNLWTILQNFGLDASGQASVMLKIPYTGHRSWDTGNVTSQGTNCRFWTSSPTSSDYGYTLHFFASAMNLLGTTKTTGCSIRPFKNNSVQPDESWTVLYQPS